LGTEISPDPADLWMLMTRTFSSEIYGSQQSRMTACDYYRSSAVVADKLDAWTAKYRGVPVGKGIGK
jgi:hypothetical protein